MSKSETYDFEHLLGQGETTRFVSPWSRLPLVGWNLLAAPLYFLGVPPLFDASERGMAYVFVAIALMISGFAYAAWIGRSVVVTNRRVIYYAALSKFVSAVPVDKIEHVTLVFGKVGIRAGTEFSALTLSVPDAEVLAAHIESARANALTSPQPGTARPSGSIGAQKKEASRAELTGGFVTLGVIALGILVYNLPEQAPTASEREPDIGQTSPSLRLEPTHEDPRKDEAVEALCAGLQLTAVDLAEARDKGVHEDIALSNMTRNSPDASVAEMVTIVVRLVYANSDVTPEVLGRLTYLTCQKSWSKQN